MSKGSGRFMFAGHAIGASARFDRLYDQTNLNHVIPTLGSSVIPGSGGRSTDHRDPYRYAVKDPRACCLLEVQRVDTFAEGRDANGVIETEVGAEVVGLGLVDKLRCDLVRMHMLVTRTNGGEPVVTTNGNRIDGLRLGGVEAVVSLEDAPLVNSGDAAQFQSHCAAKRRQLSRFGDYMQSTIVSDIQLIGSDPNIKVEGNVIVWKGFGRIVLGEIHVKGHERRLTMVRLEMGSDAGGSGSAGDGQSNGGVGTG
jgi:hypothetical protein